MQNSPPKLTHRPPPLIDSAETLEQPWPLIGGVLAFVILLLIVLAIIISIRPASRTAAQPVAASESSAEGSSPVAQIKPPDDAGEGADKAAENVPSRSSSASTSKAAAVPTAEPGPVSEALPKASPPKAGPAKAGDVSNHKRFENRTLGKIDNSLALQESPAFFGVKASGNHIGFVIDCSASMQTNSRLARAKAELIRATGDLPQAVKVTVVFFSGRVITNPKFVRFKPSPVKMTGLSKWVSSINLESSTIPVPAVQKVFSEECDQIYLLSDGDFGWADATQIRAKNYKKVPINVISMGSLTPILKSIAEESGGSFRSVVR